MRELTFPSRLPGWVLIIAVVVSAFLGAQVSLAAFAHHALGHPGSWVWHVAGGEGWHAFGVLMRCAPDELFAGVSVVGRRPPTLYQRWCREWWRAVDLWTRGPGRTFFGATMLLMTAAGTAAYLAALRRLVPRGPARRRTTTYATVDELRPFLRPRGRSPEGMLRSGALPLGRTVSEDGRSRSADLWIPLPYRRQHIWVLGVTGVGKTSGIIKRWLASDALLDGVHAPVKMSTIAVDVKDPDLWEFAAPVAMRYDRRVIRWSPLSPDSMGHNFLDYVHSVGDTVDMAETILSNDTEYNRKDPFWRQTELNMLATTLQLVCEEPADRLMPDLLREKLQNVLGVVPPPRSLAFILGLSHLHPSEFMAYIEHVDGDRTIWRDRFSKVFQARDDKTIGAWQGLQNVLVIFRDPDVIAATSRSDFPLSVVARQPTTLVIGLPRKPGSRRQVLTALFLRQLLQTLDDIARQREAGELQVPVTFLLDELGVLGLIPTFQNFVATYRDMGVSFVIATQDRAQLIDVYSEEKADTIIANLHTRIVFGRDLRPEQAEDICRALGETIVPEPGVQYEHKNPLTIVRRGTRIMYQVRRLLEPNELRALPEFRAVAVLPGDVKAQVELPPVHTDPAYQGVARQVSTIDALRYDIEMDRVLGRLTATPRITHAQSTPPRRDVLPPLPEMLQPLRTPEADPVQGAPEQQTAAHGSTSATAAPLGDSQWLCEQTPVDADDALPAGGRVEAAESAEPAITDTDGPAKLPAEVKQPTPGATAMPAPPAEESALPPLIATEHPQVIGSPLATFIVEVLHGSLRDERLAPGSPRGWVFDDKRGEFLVSWGFLRDWAFRTRRRFTDLEAAWTRDGLVRGRASLTVTGRSITCLLFSKTAALRLPSDLQHLLARAFAKGPPAEVRLSTARAAKDWGPDLPAGGKGDESAHGVGGPPPPRLIEFMQALEQAGIHFVGHPARDEEVPVHGRWRASSKGGEVLLVERAAAKAVFESVGVADATEVLTLWKQAGVLHLGGQVRSRFYTRRTHPEGNEFLALRWDQIRRYGPAAAGSRRA